MSFKNRQSAKRVFSLTIAIVVVIMANFMISTIAFTTNKTAIGQLTGDVRPKTAIGQSTGDVRPKTAIGQSTGDVRP